MKMQNIVLGFLIAWVIVRDFMWLPDKFKSIEYQLDALFSQRR